MSSLDMNRIRIQHNMGKEPQALPTAEEWAQMKLNVSLLSDAVIDLIHKQDRLLDQIERQKSTVDES